VRKIPDNTYFRLRAVTFDNVPWVVTMKKNDHYVSHSGPSVLFPIISSLTHTCQFPMSEYIKDPSVEAGWRTISHDKTKDGLGAASDAANLNPDAMDEGGEAGGSDVEPDME
jgi:hypothetical protein